MEIIKEFITYKRAKVIQKKVDKLKSSFWKCQIIEEKEYSTNKKMLKIEIPYHWYNKKKFAELIELLMEESIKYKLWFFSHYGKDNTLEIEMEIKR